MNEIDSSGSFHFAKQTSIQELLTTLPFLLCGLVRRPEEPLPASSLRDHCLPRTTSSRIFTEFNIEWRLECVPHTATPRGSATLSGRLPLRGDKCKAHTHKVTLASVAFLTISLFPSTVMAMRRHRL